MQGRLAFRNMKRSARDYLVYFLTMTFATALSFAFNTLLFEEELSGGAYQAVIMQVLIGLATFFVVLILAWLINYMVRFMLEKRSREFGTYMLLGMKKGRIARLYLLENIFLGAGAFLLGLAVGLLLQQILLAVLGAMLEKEFHFRLHMDMRIFIMTLSCYAGCYALALFRSKRRFRRMNIRDLMYAGQKNEEIKESGEEGKKWLLPLSLLFLAAFGYWLFFGKYWGSEVILGFLAGLVLIIYLFYVGLSSWIVCYVRRRGSAVYRGENLFLLRQFSSKVKTMRFTMGTLTALFTLALLRATIAMMFTDYQNQMLEAKFPFDVQAFSAKKNEDFAAERKVLKEETNLEEIYSYRIYHNGSRQVNIWLMTHLRTFGDSYRRGDGSPDLEKISLDCGNGMCYGVYDTYMKLSDYNHLRGMLGYEPVLLEEGQYLIHIKERIFNETGDFSKELSLRGKEGLLACAGYRTESFSLDGHNGADYVIVVPDREAENMDVYYSELVADIAGKAPEGLARRLDELTGADDAFWDVGGHAGIEADITGSGTDNMVVYYAKYLVRDNVIPEVKYILSAIVLPMFYMGLVFLCVALTVLAVQQFSDSAKYRFRYGVLEKWWQSSCFCSFCVRRCLPR